MWTSQTIVVHNFTKIYDNATCPTNYSGAHDGTDEVEWGRGKCCPVAVFLAVGRFIAVWSDDQLCQIASSRVRGVRHRLSFITSSHIDHVNSSKDETYIHGRITTRGVLSFVTNGSRELQCLFIRYIFRHACQNASFCSRLRSVLW